MNGTEHFEFRVGSSPLYGKGMVFTKKRVYIMLVICAALAAAMYAAAKLENSPVEPWVLWLILLLPVLMSISRRAVLKTAQVDGQRLTYRNRVYDFTELDRIETDASGDITLYTGDQVLLRLSVTDTNAEKLLEWAAKYQIPVLDRRS